MYSNYSNYSSYPVNYSNYSGNIPSYSGTQPLTGRVNSANGDRLGGFLFPFVLGGVTGGLLAPAFYPRPYYPSYGPYGPYGPYYRYY